ncbi:25S rRNA (adenine-N(1))-methyltransferase [Colletotrichum orbiculare MAFF 240422]|uniref:Ribosomal RNA-processing protein 8 n=1 Tax=Colletotrichum orbiculare (strain 104-T / ATCC 96160 / CBS 514.97 / LARS 414 / MAFF 240422) TaxID=1213857 RepID=N4VDP6_COLOR|nr:25S rRNA (adenine-N(1))-methyltransferase [Colletotrichum orbiculare MAFF 240422]
MFAVPGWSVSADALKSQTQGGPNDGAAKNKKRKRNNKDEKVTSSNLADLYENVIGGKTKEGGKRRKSEGASEETPKKKEAEVKEADEETPKASKKQKKEKKEKAPKPSAEEEEEQQQTPKSEKKEKRDKKEKKEKREKAHHDKKQAATDEQPSEQQNKATPKDDSKKKAKEAAAAIAASVPPMPPAPAKLTPLQASMRQKLISARFRHLNETLYTRPSAEAYQLFEDSPEMFSEYHEGFRRQVGVWPENPVDGYIRDIKQRARQRTPHRGAPPSRNPNAPAALPRTDGTCVIADLGCGDARLAATLAPEAQKLRLDIRSYDLHSPAKYVTKADIANLPLADGSVDVAIFCLALMGTNWIDFIEEAYRILHWKGELWVAEIKSRFGPVRAKNAPVAHSVGNRKKQATAAAAAPKKTKGGDPEETAADRMALAVEVDGQKDRRGETDVSAFVDALRKRGFVLQGEGEGNKGAVDLSNKMFVKMHFVKAAVPTKGKGLIAARAAGFVEKEKKQKRFVWDTEDDKVDENNILKPCLYKIR